VNLGQDISGLVEMLAAKNVCVRGPTGPHVPFLYTKHVSTAVKHYRPPLFSSEPADGSASRQAIAEALFKDLTTGVDWHFDYHENLQRAEDLFAWYRQQPRGREPLVDVALLFPTSAHRLDNWNTWSGEGFAGGYPQGLMQFAEALRDIVDYDVVDERLIASGVLARYSMLVWPCGLVAEKATLDEIAKWIRSGGMLLVSELVKVRTMEGEACAFAAVLQDSGTQGLRRLGQGWVYDARGELEKLPQIVFRRHDLHAIHDAWPSSVSKLPAIDRAVDGVLVSLMDEGILMLNRNEQPVTKQLPKPLTDRPHYRNLPSEVRLEPHSLKWLPAQLVQSP
jgi:hypothetical protein